jgi:hypothetical protein
MTLNVLLGITHIHIDYNRVYIYYFNVCNRFSEFTLYSLELCTITTIP